MSHNNSYIKWPYPILYEQEGVASSDVLVLGGGIAGCWAALTAARQGASVLLVDKGCIIRSGCGGPGCDHWAWSGDNPACTSNPDEMAYKLMEARSNWTNGITSYINCASGYETLLELEQMGAKIRDTEDEFKGADFRDERTKMMYAYDYENRTIMRVWGATFKPALYSELKRLGVKLYERCQATSLLTAGGKAGNRVIGATGLNIQTGQFMIFKAKAIVMAMAMPARNWVFSTEHRGVSSFKPVVNSGNGHAMAWRAGATVTNMERSLSLLLDSHDTLPAYGDGNCNNTWHPCNMVDADGKAIPWVDRDGNAIKDVASRSLPSKLGQEMFLMIPGLGGKSAYDSKPPMLIADIQERVLKGEYKLPLYADLTTMPDDERRVIWGMMVGSESKTKTPILKVYTDAGFDPEKDLLQSYFMLGGSSMMREPAAPKERMIFSGGGGVVVDWNLMSTLEGLFAAGEQIFSTNGHASAATTGRYVGKRTAEYIQRVNGLEPDRLQVDKEKARVYAPIYCEDGVDWKEFNAGLCRIMQNYCSEHKTESLMQMGLGVLDEYEREELPSLCADDPHKLGRTVDVMDILTVDQMIIHGCMSRKASSSYLNFGRLDYPQKDPPEWHKWLTLKLEDGAVKKGELPIDYWGSLKENYEAYSKGKQD
jgi:succinate dehydrogenase/fumarate reductase flavoprotein subunit